MKAVCTKCRTEKAVDLFPHAKGVRHSWCRDCMNAYKKAWRLKWRESNPRKKRIAADYMTEDGQIICSNCRSPWPTNHYQNGRVGWCRKCCNEQQANVRRAAGVKKKPLSEILGDTKKCVECQEFKPLEEFSLGSRGRGGRAAYCRECYKTKYYTPEKARRATQKYRDENREKWRAEHRLNQFARRSKIAITDDGTVTPTFLRDLYDREKCEYCREDVPPGQRSADHVLALSQGGAHSAGNLVMACKTCNGRKREMPVEEFKRRLKSK